AGAVQPVRQGVDGHGQHQREEDRPEDLGERAQPGDDDDHRGEREQHDQAAGQGPAGSRRCGGGRLGRGGHGRMLRARGGPARHPPQMTQLAVRRRVGGGRPGPDRGSGTVAGRPPPSRGMWRSHRSRRPRADDAGGGFTAVPGCVRTSWEGRAPTVDDARRVTPDGGGEGRSPPGRLATVTAAEAGVTGADVDRMAGRLFVETPGQRSAFWVLLVLAAVIAGAGVVADSTATVIGAMIVAPLMTPILGAAFALVLADARRVTTSTLLVVGGAVAVVAIGYALGLLVPEPLVAE